MEELNLSLTTNVSVRKQALYELSNAEKCK